MCQHADGCPKGTPEQPKSLTLRNQSIYTHYRECRAVGHFPDDEWVRFHAVIIRDIEDHIRDMRELKLAGLRR